MAAQAVLSLVFMIGIITVIAAITLAFVVLGFVNSGLGAQAAYRALAAASAGANDALLTLARNKDFASSGYTFPVGNFSTVVTVVQNLPQNGKATITADASVAGHERKISIVAAVSSSTGAIDIVSWNQITF